ncbi:MAG TPA: DUF2703 domain-containing protein [Ideonella sp.]|uniref:DUF2703 domain-containing protein n=1 Tax=Ideonella sp. TaxID=1929293 RepID=UPI002E30B371|nr:DUF2703 domain-containing protein [Ideonella sp.]HEX5685304.1 DUF2703 domain-containing protein [Ideonella sp.]
MRQLPIVWKRLVKDGNTCERCGSTWLQLQAAVGKLEIALGPLGIQPVLKMETIDERTFKAEPSESNRIFLAGRPMEQWIGATAGMSRCCSVCGDSDCRTLELDGAAYETIPAELIIKAGLVAASQLLAPSAMTQPESASCGCGTCPGK